MLPRSMSNPMQSSPPSLRELLDDPAQRERLTLPRRCELFLELCRRLSALHDFFQCRAAGDREEVWRWDDPVPFIVESLRWFAAR